jgi:hypothetical protein
MHADDITFDFTADIRPTIILFYLFLETFTHTVNSIAKPQRPAPQCSFATTNTTVHASEQ